MQAFSLRVIYTNVLIEKSKPRGEQARERGGGIEMPIPTGNIKQTTEQSSVDFGKDVFTYFKLGVIHLYLVFISWD